MADAATPTESEQPRSRRRSARTGTRGSGVRRHNLAVLLERLHVEGSTSRSELGAGLGLNRSTIAVLAQELDECGLVVEQGVALAVRPGTALADGPREARGGGREAVEVGVESVAVATIGLGGHVFDLATAALPRPGTSPEDLVGLVADLPCR